MRRRAGFSLLEVMIAMAILAGALLGLSLSISRSVAASNHARLMTQATFLCRQVIVELEQDFIVNGFTDDAIAKEEKDKEFEDKALSRFRYSYRIEKILLPSVDKIQSAATKLLQDKQTTGGESKPSGGSDGSLNGANPAMVGDFLGPVKQTLENAIRRVTVSVNWVEGGRPLQSVEVVTYYTDMRRIPTQ